MSAFCSTKFSSLYSVRVFALFLWRRWPVLNLTRRNIDDELRELGGIAGAFTVTCQDYFSGLGSALMKSAQSQYKPTKVPIPAETGIQILKRVA